MERAKLVVVGGGPGGYAAAFMAADLGIETVLVDPGENPGGVCLYRGCIPSKALLHAAKLVSEAREAKELGLDFGRPKLDVKKLRAWKEGVVAKLTGGVGQLARTRKVRHLRATARFADAHALELEAGGKRQALAFEHAILATGSRPVRLPFLPDSPRVWDSTSALELKEVPASLLVIGGGYIGLELGTVYAELGSKVTVVEMTDGLLPGCDRDLVRVLQKRVEGLFERILLSTKVVEVKEGKGGLKARFEGAGAPKEAVFDAVLAAVGRRPNSDGLGLENTKVELDPRGFVRTDAQCRTAEPSILAIGDVRGEPMLAHKAAAEGRAAAEVVREGKAHFEPKAIPAVVFTDPEIAWCGLTEAQAEKEGRAVQVSRYPWGASGRALTLGRPDGVTKLIVDPADDRVLGVGIAGAGAGELIGEAVVAVEMGATARDLGLSIHAHPTLSETLMEAADALHGFSTHFYRARKG